MYYLYFIAQIVFAIILGGLIGWQREHIGKAAGMRTHALVCMGAMLFSAMSITAFSPSDPGRVAAQIITGIGFLGAGAILHRQDKIEGLTTAAGLWVVAAIGMAIGVGWLVHALIATFFIFILLLFPHKN